MPDPRQVEEGEVEDGEVTTSGSTSNGYGSQYRSSSLAPNGALKRPSIQIGLNKLAVNRGIHRPSLLDDDSSSGSTLNRVSPAATELTIKGAAVTPSQPSTTLQNNENGLYIKGRSGSSNGDHPPHDSELDSGAQPATSVFTGPSGRTATADQPSFRGSRPGQIIIKGANAAGLPNKPSSIALPLPFKSKVTMSRPSTGTSAPLHSTPGHYQAPSNAVGKGYGNAMIVPKMQPAVPIPGPSFTPPPRSSVARPPSPSARPPSPPSRLRSPTPPPPPPPTSLPVRVAPLPFLPARPPTPQDWSRASPKGKAKEHDVTAYEEAREDLEEGEEPSEHDTDKPLFAARMTPDPRSSPDRGGRSARSIKTAERTRFDDNDDDRRRASFGRSQGDRWESSYRSPRSSRYSERGYESTSRRHEARDRDDDRYSRRRDEDDDSYHRRRSGYDSYEDDDRHRSHRSRDWKSYDRERYIDDRKHRGGDRDTDYRYSKDRDYDRDRGRGERTYHSSRHDDSREKKGNVWRRGSSYSPNDGDRSSSKRALDFHDEPGAPRHFDRELASTRKSLPSTPSLPAKPVADLPERPGPSRKDAPPIVAPLPQAATPFFLDTPPPSDYDTRAPWDDGEDVEAKMDIAEGTATERPSKVEVTTFTLFGASPLSQYILEEKLGEGTFGVVHKARRKEGSVTVMPTSEQERRFKRDTKRRIRQGRQAAQMSGLGASRVQEGDVVALKKIVMHNDMDGVPITALREIRILKTLDHPNVVSVVDMAYQSGDYLALRRGAIYMVFPYMAHDLAGLLENKKIIALDQGLLKLYAKQLLLGTSYLHRNKILHRDMKAANLLLSNDGVLQIADFGLARSIEMSKEGKRREYTNCVVTRWYRPPELLLGLRAYGPPIDMWGVGCVIGEMFFRHPVFTGSSDLDQISRIVQMCGTIDETTMPGWDKLPESGAIQIQRGARNVKREFSRFSDNLADLLDKLLVYDPDTRLTADQALDHDWFWSDPLPAEVGSVQAFPSSHEYDKRKAAEERQGQGGEKARAAQAAAFKGANQVARIPAASITQPVQVQAPPPMPTMQANPWENQSQLNRQAMHMHNQGPPQSAMSTLPARPGLPARPMVVPGQMPQARGYPIMAPMASYNNGMAGMQMQNTHYHQPPHMQQPAFLQPNVRQDIAGRSNHAWRGSSDPAAKRQKLADPPGRLKLAGRSSMTSHADSLGGHALPMRPAGQRRGASAYDDGAPAGSAEPLD